MINLWPLLLPAAAWSGWWVARRQQAAEKPVPQSRLSREYMVGLNYLLDEQPDKAVDVFIRLLEADSDTVETHLALGSLFRRRGEVDRAIRIHQNLIARPQLQGALKRDALMALGQDYLSAGVLDRAERIFHEVLELGGVRETRSLQGLLTIHQQEKAWEKALETLRKLESATGQSMHVQAAHFYCEMAQKALDEKKPDKAEAAIRQALQADKNSVRASLMQARQLMENGRYREAIRALVRVPKQDVDFLTEIIEPLVECHTQCGTMEECIRYLEKSIEDAPRASTIFVVADYLRREKSLEAAIDFVAVRLNSHQSIRGLTRLIQWHLDSAYGKVREKLQMLYDITSRFMDNKPIYRCGYCGFGGKHLHWHCPSCKQWGKMKPVLGLEGE